MPYPVKCLVLFLICEAMVQVLLMSKGLFTQDSEVKDLFCGVSPGSEPRLFFSNNSSAGVEPVQDDFQTDKADGSVVLAEL